MDIRVFQVPTERVAEVEKAVARLSKKAAKYGKSLTVTYSDPHPARRGICKVSNNTVSVVDYEMVEVVDVTFESELIVNEGYQILARLEHLENGNFVNCFTDMKDEAWTHLPARCEHCGGKHHQKVTFIVSNGTECKQVGSTCLKEYCGIDPQCIGFLNELQDVLINNDIEFGCEDYRPHGSMLYDVKEALARAIRCIKLQGYVKSGEYHANKERLYTDFVQLKDEDLKEAEEMVAEIKAMGEREAYACLLDNVKVLAENGYCKMEHMGYIAYAPVAYKKMLEKKAEQERKAAEGARSDYVGEVGERLTVSVKHWEVVSSFETMYGTTLIIKFVDEDNNVLIWYSSTGINGDTADNCVVKGTVKEHTEYNGVKQTVLTRCKIA